MSTRDDDPDFQAGVERRVQEILAERKYLKALIEWKVAHMKGLADETTHPDEHVRDEANRKFIRDYDERARFEQLVSAKMTAMRIANGTAEWEPDTDRRPYRVRAAEFMSGKMAYGSPPPDPNQPAWRSVETKTAFPEDVERAFERARRDEEERLRRLRRWASKYRP